MPQSRIGGEQLPAFLGTGEPDRRVREALFRGIQNDAGHGDVGAERHTRKDENVFNRIGIAIQNTRPANSLVARHQMMRHAGRDAPRDHFGKQFGIHAAQTRFEKIRQPFDHDAEQLAIAAAREQIV